ncbi:MAG: DUF2330 domain-containing protein [Limisphaerales bacterium]
MRRLLSFLLFLLPLSAFADGMVFPTVAFPAKIKIPDQQALIHFTNGTERLVIETHFVGAGTNFAWVVPLPSEPVIEKASAGLFPTLDYIFRPEIIHDVPKHYAAILALTWLLYLLFFVRPTGRMNLLDVTACILVVIGVVVSNFESSGLGLAILDSILFVDLMVVTILIRFWKRFNIFTNAILIALLAIQFSLVLPTLTAARAKSMSTSSSAENVSILNRQIVGIFETTTIASHDPKALQTWLQESGFVVSTNSNSAIENYVKENWIFVAVKIRRDRTDAETSAPQPLSFTFKTEKAVYPMQLTGTDNRPLKVELFVFGQTKAEAAHFKVASCVRPTYPPSSDYWSYRMPDQLQIVHPLLQKWVKGSPVVTKLVGTLTPEQMRDDVQLNWTVFSEKRERLFSHTGAWIEALNWGTGFFAAGLCVTFICARRRKDSQENLLKSIGIPAILGIALTGAVYLALPKTDVRLIKGFYSDMRNSQLELEIALRDSDSVELDKIRAETTSLLAAPTNDLEWTDWTNYFLGGRIHEEDSPGNYIFRETNGHLEFVTFDANGAEQVQTFGD